MSLFDLPLGAQSASLTDLLAIEDSSELLALKCPETGIPVWPVMRIAFLRLIMADLLFGSGSMAPPNRPAAGRALMSLTRSAAHNARARVAGALKANVLINTDGIGDELRDGRWFNRYADPFGDATPGGALIMVDMFDWRFRAPRHNERFLFHTPIQVAATLLSRRSPRSATSLARAAVEILCERACRLLDWRLSSERRATFETWAARKIASLPFKHASYTRLLRRSDARLLLSSTACYGAHAPLLAAAHDLDITTAEYQHGAVSRGHDAYNFAGAIHADRSVVRTLPRYFLTYGAWWNGQISAPVECVTIGNPLRSERVSAEARPASYSSTILILSDGIEFDLYLDLARTVARLLDEDVFSVVLRPHPLERQLVLERFGNGVDGVAFDMEPSIYSSIAKAHTVVSEVSTGLFEAVGLAGRIVILDTPKARFAYPEFPFPAASSATQIVDLVRSHCAQSASVSPEELWAPDWQGNYRWFLQDKVGIKTGR